MKENNLEQTALISELSLLIEQSKQQVIAQVNSTLTILFWQMGKRINEDILQNKRADYGKQIVSTLSTQLEIKYGRNFTEKNVRRMMQFAEQFPDNGIVVTLSRQLSWSHFLVLIPLKTQEERTYYAKEVSGQNLGVRELRKQITSKTFERSSLANLQNISKHPAIRNTFKDPYFLDFLGLQNTYFEKDLEAAIL